MRSDARQSTRGCRALLYVLCVLLLSALSVAAELAELRVAAILSSERGSKALIEIADGEQRWFREGDRVAGAILTTIAPHEITLQGPDGSFRLPLRGAPVPVTDAVAEEASPPSRHEAREFQVLALLSEINSVEPVAGESYEDAAARTLNTALGLGADARITAVGRVQVATADEARQELQRQLGGAEVAPVRLTLENDYLEDMYVMPQ
jgi:hypothetical protein